MSVTYSRPASAAATSTTPAPAGADSLGSQGRADTQTEHAAEGQTSPQAIAEAIPNEVSPAGSRTSRSHTAAAIHDAIAAADNFPGGQTGADAHGASAAGDQAPVQTYAWLAFAADIVDDLERVRIANENRLRTLTSTDGDYGWGLDESHADVARLAALVAMLAEAEHKATLNLQRAMRNHPLGPWVASQRGIGEKQAARLLAAIGDPYIRFEITLEDGTTEPPRPRTVSELWAYCGLAPGQKRKRGEKSNWSADAKMRAWNIAGSMLKAGNRAVYDKRKAATDGRLHETECVRCGPSGHPAQPGTPWSDAHRHADALRVVSKEVLKELWREARRIHLETPVSGHGGNDTQSSPAADGT